MNATQHSTNRPDAVTGRDECLSVLADARAEASELDRLMSGLDAEAADTLQRYELIGDILRSGMPRERSCSDPQRFLAGVRAGIAQEAPVVRPVPALQPAVAVVPARPAAANDGVFRWKMVAGFASLAAVMAVSWNLLGTGTPAGLPGNAAPVLVQAPAGNPVDADPPEAVLVMTPQGAVVRDPQLEQLLNEHRQFGGMTALQAPTGFLRNATYDREGR